ncbi:MAG: cobalt-precorrin-5B (C(1))-methyltransferase [Nitrospirae bacterium CG_4_8_14_3_um_filter_50_41]|nr:MAG: cobalt-precorrin-5B (C(1))-methyltransferase [Nitrospirae bacterium CG_4_8_14_3_um_filter_50_41]
MKNDEVSDRPLRKGYTTGACAAAAAKSAALVLVTGVPVYRIEIDLPAGGSVVLPVKTLRCDDLTASCSVVKDAGDDPDVTHGAEIMARVRKAPGEADQKGYELTIAGGEGVGRVTKPGLPIAVGEWAINPVPRSMIANEVTQVLRHFSKKCQGVRFEVTIEVPEGKNLAEKTLNPRLGILGGISILGTTGIVEPLSHKAWEETIAAQIQVAVACGNQAVVLTPGRSSEKAAEALLPGLPSEAFVQMGDFVGASLRLCSDQGVSEVTVVAMPGKMSKIAMGYEDTHYKASELRFDVLGSWAVGLGMDEGSVQRVIHANTSREIWEILPEDSPLYNEICRRARESCESLSSGKVRVKTVLIGYDGKVLADTMGFEI